MAKKMDGFAEEFIAMLRARADATKLRRELKLAEDEAKRLNNILAEKMGRSIIGSIDGREMFEVRDTLRTTYTKEKVMRVCPELEPELRNEHRGKRIEPLPSAFGIK